MTRALRVTTLEHHWTLHVERPKPEVVRVEITGAWRKEEQLPDPSEVWRDRGWPARPIG
jgi:hypothetical protein